MLGPELIATCDAWLVTVSVIVAVLLPAVESSDFKVAHA